MINALRKKFIWMTMVSVCIVFTIIIGIINIVNFSRVRTDTDNVIDYLAQNNGNFEGNKREDIPPQQKEELPDESLRDEFFRALEEFKLGKETPYSTRYFTVIINNDEAYIRDYNVASVTKDDALVWVETVLSSGKTSGYFGDYRYKKVQTDDGLMLIFVDASSQLSGARNMLWISLIVGVSSIIAILILILCISKKVVKPIAESYEKQKQFITDASHELKTPLTIISANNEISEIEHGESESTKAISKQVNRMATMVKNLTALARLDEMSALDSAELNLTSIVVDSVELFRPALTTNDRTFDIEIEKDVKIDGDEKLIKQLLAIVLENASKYAKTHTSLKLFTQGQKVVILAQNDADGIKDEEMNQCFERFYRSSESRASGVEGSGIGLSIAKEIVLKHKGSISAYGDAQGWFNLKIVF
ncbi:MAG: HAMP domain-containing histidine kinase [Clostridia bacterium]|nr:HAMP domain-containing histidine kinase [Clostridia bacterium]